MSPDTPQPDAAKPATETVTAERILTEGRMTRDESQMVHARDLVREFATQALDEGMTVNDNVVTAIKTRIAQIDQRISDQLNGILHHPEYQQLEASWRGLHYLVMNSETGTRLKLRLLNVTKKELLTDLEKATEFDQSVLFKKVYEEEYGTFGGHPYSCLVGDFEFGRHPQDVKMLEMLSGMAAAAHAPLIASACGKRLDMENLTEWRSATSPRDSRPRSWSRGAPSVRWRTRATWRWSCRVCCSGCRTGPKPFRSTGSISPRTSRARTTRSTSGATRRTPWANGSRTRSRSTDGRRPSAALGGGVVEGWPAHTFKTDDGDIALKCPTETAITDRREKELSDLGFVSLCHCKGTDFAAFFGGQTTNKPKQYNTDQANANARVSSNLPYVLYGPGRTTSR
jgi:type VI secretion system protein ImpC